MTAKIRLMSDLHIEFGKFKIPQLPDDQDTILVLAGDIHVGRTHRNWIDRYLPNFKHIVMITGNHEYYNCEMEDIDDYWLEYANKVDNLSFLRRNKVQIDNIVFYGDIMWTDLNNGDPLTAMIIRQMLNDYKKIYLKGNVVRSNRRITTDDVISMHNECIDFFTNNIPKKDDTDDGLKHVVVTHHLPSELSIDKQFAHQQHINCAYYSDLNNFINERRIDFWFHGHTHASKRYKIGNTEIICNPRGYCPSELNKDFDPKLLIEV